MMMFETILLRTFVAILKTSLGMTPFLIIMLLLENTFRKQYSAAWKYSLFFLILLRLLIPIYTGKEKDVNTFNNLIPEVTTNVENIEKEVQMEVNKTDEKIIPKISVIPTITIPTFLSQNKSRERFTIFASIWLFIVIAKLLYLTGNYIVFYKKIIRWRTIPFQKNTFEIYYNVCHDMEIKKIPSIFVCHAIESPMCFGIFQKGIYITKEKMSTQEIEMILKHELCHYKRKDLKYQLLCVLVSTIHFFNPFVTAFVKITERDIELSCDDVVMEHCSKDKRKQYGVMLLSMMKESKENILSNYFAKEGKFMKKRFENILDTTPKKKGSLLLSLLGILYLLSTGISIFTAKQQLTLLFYFFNIFALFSFCFIISTRQKKKKILFAMTILCISVNGFLAGCSQNITSLENDLQQSEYTDEQIERLLKWKTDYVGDNSAVGNILTELHTDGMIYGGFEIQSDTQPYGIKVYYDIEDLSKIEDSQFHKNSMILFSLIGNLGYTEYHISYENQEKMTFRDVKDDMTPYYGAVLANVILEGYTDSVVSYRYFLEYLDNPEPEKSYPYYSSMVENKEDSEFLWHRYKKEAFTEMQKAYGDKNIKIFSSLLFLCSPFGISHQYENTLKVNYYAKTKCYDFIMIEQNRGKILYFLGNQITFAKIVFEQKENNAVLESVKLRSNESLEEFCAEDKEMVQFLSREETNQFPHTDEELEELLKNYVLKNNIEVQYYCIDGKTIMPF